MHARFALGIVAAASAAGLAAAPARAQLHKAHAAGWKDLRKLADEFKKFHEMRPVSRHPPHVAEACSKLRTVLGRMGAQISRIGSAVAEEDADWAAGQRRKLETATANLIKIAEACEKAAKGSKDLSEPLKNLRAGISVYDEHFRDVKEAFDARRRQHDAEYKKLGDLNRNGADTFGEVREQVKATQAALDAAAKKLAAARAEQAETRAAEDAAFGKLVAAQNEFDAAAKADPVRPEVVKAKRDALTAASLAAQKAVEADEKADAAVDAALEEEARLTKKQRNLLDAYVRTWTDWQKAVADWPKLQVVKEKFDQEYVPFSL